MAVTMESSRFIMVFPLMQAQAVGAEVGRVLLTVFVFEYMPLLDGNGSTWNS
jgi:hypothetical protein